MRAREQAAKLAPTCVRRACSNIQAAHADDTEMIEEYDLTTSELLLRKKRRPKALGRPAEWEYMRGEEAPGCRQPQGNLMESSTNVRYRPQKKERPPRSASTSCARLLAIPTWAGFLALHFGYVSTCMVR